MPTQSWPTSSEAAIGSRFVFDLELIILEYRHICKLRVLAAATLPLLPRLTSRYPSAHVGVLRQRRHFGHLGKIHEPSEALHVFCRLLFGASVLYRLPSRLGLLRVRFVDGFFAQSKGSNLQ